MQHVGLGSASTELISVCTILVWSRIHLGWVRNTSSCFRLNLGWGLQGLGRPLAQKQARLKSNICNDIGALGSDRPMSDRLADFRMVPKTSVAPRTLEHRLRSIKKARASLLYAALLIFRHGLCAAPHRKPRASVGSCPRAPAPTVRPRGGTRAACAMSSLGAWREPQCGGLAQRRIAAPKYRRLVST